MHRLNPKYIRIASIVLGILLLITLIGGYLAYSKREAILQSAINKAKAKAKAEYNLDVKIGQAHFTGLSTVAFSNISVVPEQRDSLLSIRYFVISVKLMPLIIGDIKLADVGLHDGHLNLVSKNGVRNFDFLFKKKKNSNKKSTTGLNDLADNLINQVLYKIPDNLNLTNFNTTFTDDSNQVKLFTRSAIIKDGDLMSTIVVNDNYATWHLAGKLNPSDKEIDVKLYAQGRKFELPFLESKFKLKLNFDTLTTRLNKVEHGNDETQIYTYLAVRNLLINHPALSDSNVTVPVGSIDANLFVGGRYVSLDSSSVIHLKKITAHPYVKYTMRPTKIFAVKMHTDWLPAQDVFDSFPQGLFTTLEGIKVTGKVRYNLHLFLDTSRPDDVQFESGMAQQGFRIVQFGKTDFDKLNKPFTYVPYEKGKPMPARFIGPSNPNFTPIDQIAPELQHAVMTAEDPSFYTHHGFVQESLRRSIATNLKEKKFKRGGSTISMQLVKNTFLSRKKTLVRKVEEAIIVWMIENTRLMSKRRMLEVYFNIIEWGRNIYGIGEASHFYFGKSPSDLTIGESIYLASIVPNPKAGLYAFEPDGTLRYRLHGYFRLIGNLMASRGWAQRDTNAYGFYNVRLREGLRQRIAPVDTAVADSILANPDAAEGDEQVVPPGVTEAPKEPGFFQRLFGKKDTSKVQASPDDSAKANRKREREARREQKRLEKERLKALHDRGLG
ncbi:transglycosylase domain-containing protein [Mucilaginibacter lacusdianchii]|uniref:transglycosylase domain-containing protein n=1 Tax=Mucilaginibacter lacusdianchii TaxID=2684211 RepID=UPI00131E6C21|nr:biosynthetic peptidoglycan transglycosylase [Mucilaginibacter sp. JXJ CY 39]